MTCATYRQPRRQRRGSEQRAVEPRPRSDGPGAALPAHD